MHRRARYARWHNSYDDDLRRLADLTHTQHIERVESLGIPVVPTFTVPPIGAAGFEPATSSPKSSTRLDSPQRRIQDH